MPDTTPDADQAEAPKPSRKQRREEKRRLHDAQKKARAIEKANDKRVKGANLDEKKADKSLDKAQKKTEKGKTEKAQKKTDKAVRLRARVRR